MSLEVLSLKVLATRYVVKNKLDYSTYLNGTAKDELDGLERIEGSFRTQASKTTIEAHYKGVRLPSDDWRALKECLKDHLSRHLIKVIEGEGFFIIQQRKRETMTRTWDLDDVDGYTKNLLWSKGELVLMRGAWFQFDDFIEDGSIVRVHKAFKMFNGKMVFFLDCRESITCDKQGNVIRKFMWSLPDKDIKITKVMWALRVGNIGHC